MKIVNFCLLIPGDSPNKDPLIVRNRFEGLLEGAMKMYNGKEDVVTELPSKFEYKRKENRGKSAGFVSQLFSFKSF